MKNQYLDIIKQAGEPVFYDANGTPRYEKFGRWNSGKSTSRASALFITACQKCHKRFTVVSAIKDDYRWVLQNQVQRAEALADFCILTKESLTPEKLLEALKPREDDIPKIVRPSFGNIGHFSYGDPPIHGCIGDTMGSFELQVLEYWEQNRIITDGSIQDRYGNHIGGKRLSGDFDWIRYPEHEVDVRNDYARKNFTF